MQAIHSFFVFFSLFDSLYSFSLSFSVSLSHLLSTQLMYTGIGTKPNSLLVWNNKKQAKNSSFHSYTVRSLASNPTIILFIIIPYSYFLWKYNQKLKTTFNKTKAKFEVVKTYKKFERSKKQEKLLALSLIPRRLCLRDSNPRRRTRKINW